jgi:hypothetical protein
VYRLSTEPQDCDREGDAPWQHPRVTLQAFPGGHETFELVVRFCYTDDGRGVSHENRNAVLFGEEPVVVASLADGGTTIWDTSAATTASNAPVESTSGIMRWHCFTTSATACHSQCSISSSAFSVIAVHGSGDTELSHSEADKVPATAALPNPREKICCRFVDRTKLSRQVRLIHFSLPSPDQALGIPTDTHAGPALRIWWPGARQKLRPHYHKY